MNKQSFLLPLILIIASCNDVPKNRNSKSEKQVDFFNVGSEASNSEAKSSEENWYYGLIGDYIKKSNNELIKLAVKNNNRIDWFLDRTEKTDSTNYYIFNIGQHITDENNTNARFSSIGWICIDS